MPGWVRQAHKLNISQHDRQFERASERDIERQVQTERGTRHVVAHTQTRKNMHVNYNGVYFTSAVAVLTYHVVYIGMYMYDHDTYKV